MLARFFGILRPERIESPSAANATDAAKPMSYAMEQRNLDRLAPSPEAPRRPDGRALGSLEVFDPQELAKTIPPESSFVLTSAKQKGTRYG